MTKSTPPGPAGLPLLGSVFPWLRNQPRFLLETYRRYGEVVRFEFLGFHGAILHGAEANRYILIDAVDNFQVGPVIDRASAPAAASFDSALDASQTHRSLPAGNARGDHTDSQSLAAW